MKIYLAGRVSRRPTLQQWDDRLTNLGHTIVSRWSKRNSDHIGPSGQASDADRRRYAEEDIEDLIKCDCVISLMEDPRGSGRGGRHAEFGYALALDKHILIVGPKETVFHHLPNVGHFDSFEALLTCLTKEAEELRDAR